MLSLAALLLPASSLQAQPAIDVATRRPSAAAVRIDPAEAPTIDGDISDAVWAKATLIDEFYQLEPDTGRPTTQPTSVRILFDSETIYFAIHAGYTDPDSIIATVMARDANLFTGDYVRIYLDPGLTRRNGYTFEINPLGARRDQIAQNNLTLLKEWNTIWTGRVGRVADGWTAEIAVPFRSISYDPANTNWGLEVSRLIKARNEQVRWSGIRPRLEPADLSLAGTLTGVEPDTAGIGLEVKMYGALRYKHEYDNSDNDLTFSPSGSAFYKITPALTATLTANPDFSDAPLDQRRVNTTRFGLFTPETRDFFLQDAAAFEFGGLNFAQPMEPRENGRPFFSRRLGLVDGLPVGIYAGAKLSGEVAGATVGALTVMTEETDFVNSQVLSIARATIPVLEESKAGFILTNGDPTGATENTVTGVDFQYLNTNVLGGTLHGDAFYQRSFSDAVDDDDSYGLALVYPNEPVSLDFRFKEVGADFSPLLGFVNRRGIRDYDTRAAYRHRYADSWLRWAEGSFRYRAITDLDDRLETETVTVEGLVQLPTGDEYSVAIENVTENLVAPDTLPGGVVIPAGNYNWTNTILEIETTDGRPLKAELEVTCCSFFGGDYFSADLTLDYRPNATIQFIPRYVFTRIVLPTGDVTIHILQTDLSLNFTPDMQLQTQVQYDNITRDLTALIRYRWEYQPGEEIFASIGQSGFIPGQTYDAHSTVVAFRLGHTLRF